MRGEGGRWAGGEQMKVRKRARDRGGSKRGVRRRGPAQAKTAKEARSETDTQEPEKQAKAKTKAHVYSGGPEAAGGALSDQGAGHGGGKLQALAATAPTSLLPSHQPPARHCADAAQLQPASWPGQWGGSYCTLYPAGREKFQPCLGQGEEDRGTHRPRHSGGPSCTFGTRATQPEGQGQGPGHSLQPRSHERC